MLVLALTIVLLGTASLPAQEPPGASAPAETDESFDPLAATRGYLDKVPADKREKSDAYFEGGYWIQLWQFLLSAGIALLLLATGLSRRMRDLACRIAPWKPLQTWLYWIQYLVAVTVLSFPMSVYVGFMREHKYGLSTHTFASWLGDEAKGLMIGVLLGGLLMVVLYGVLRRTPRTWWLWGSITSIIFLVFTIMIAPVYIAPLFNKYTKLEDARVKEPILRLARANGIPAEDVYVMDASRQTTRVSANVSGLLGTMRITLNDNLLNRCSLAEIESVMAHEMGHYVLNHIAESIIFFGILIVVVFAVTKVAFDRVVARRGASWGISGIGDPAALPLLMLLISICFFVLTPVTNHNILVNEAEADLFGLNAARQPEGFAEVALKLGDYRKLDPGPIEEFVFFDHPSGRARIFMAMQWKANQAVQEQR